MKIPRDLRLAATVIAILMVSSNAGAQEPGRRLEPTPVSSEHKEVTGILTDRLTRSQLKAWGSIMQIVLARDGERRPVHPILYGLYRQAETSGLEIQIELSTQRATMCAVGFCRIELRTERTQKEVVVIGLNLGMIDRAIATERARRADGFVPLAGLKKRERYAEVLGHELAHVVRLLTNSDYRSLYRERQVLADNGSQDIHVIRRLTSLIEKPAEAAEIEIWRELTAGREPEM